jgi:hypothetical protein
LLGLVVLVTRRVRRVPGRCTGVAVAVPVAGDRNAREGTRPEGEREQRESWDSLHLQVFSLVV